VARTTAFMNRIGYSNRKLPWCCMGGARPPLTKSSLREPALFGIRPGRSPSTNAGPGAVLQARRYSGGAHKRNTGARARAAAQL
jgi:hypothetical protein